MRRFRYRLEWVGVVFAMRVVPLLPRKILLFIGKALGTVVWAFDLRGRQTAEANLRFALGVSRESGGLARAAYQNMARTFLELFWTPNLDAERFAALVDETSIPPGIPPRTPGKPSVLVSPHFGNFEWLPHARAYEGRTLLILAQDLKNPLLTPLFVKLREHTGHTLISRQGGLLRLMRHLRQGGETAFLTDLTVPPDRAATIVECFGFPTSATASHIELARRTGAVLEPYLMVPLPDGRYLDVRGTPIEIEGRTNAEAAQACWDFYEPLIRKYPQGWLWMYKHWRYLPPGIPPEGFPAYANRSKKFDSLLARERAVPLPPRPSD